MPDRTTRQIRTQHTALRPGGFTLIELLVVVAIVALLIGIVVAVGSRVGAGARQRATLDTIRVLDTAMDSYINATGSIPKAYVISPVDGDELMPVLDGVFAGAGGDLATPDLSSEDPQRPRLINSVGLFLLQAREVESADAVIRNLDAKLVAVRPVYSPSDATIDGLPGLQTVLDGWGRPIRYVHPKLDGILGAARAKNAPGAPPAYPVVKLFPDQDPAVVGGANAPRAFSPAAVRRNRILPEEFAENGGDLGTGQRDSDGGQAPGDRPYFYSAGPDGDPATVADNVYSTTPTFVAPF